MLAAAPACVQGASRAGDGGVGTSSHTPARPGASAPAHREAGADAAGDALHDSGAHDAQAEDGAEAAPVDAGADADADATSAPTCVPHSACSGDILVDWVGSAPGLSCGTTTRRCWFGCVEADGGAACAAPEAGSPCASGVVHVDGGVCDEAMGLCFASPGAACACAGCDVAHCREKSILHLPPHPHGGDASSAPFTLMRYWTCDADAGDAG